MKLVKFSLLLMLSSSSSTHTRDDAYPVSCMYQNADRQLSLFENVPKALAVRVCWQANFDPSWEKTWICFFFNIFDILDKKIIMIITIATATAAAAAGRLLYCYNLMGMVIPVAVAVACAPAATAAVRRRWRWPTMLLLLLIRLRQ